VTFEHIEQIRALLDPGKSGKMVQIPGEIVAIREFDTLTIRPPLGPPGNFDYELQIPGTVHIHELGTMFRAEVLEAQHISQNPGRVFVDGGRLGPYVRIRTWKSGDYYRPVGLPAGKLKKLFQRARIPRSQRSSWPVFVTDSAVVWVASFPVSREFAPCGSSQKIVAFEAIPD
jgi:tRNA(Ile)-lysidine synthase